MSLTTTDLQHIKQILRDEIHPVEQKFNSLEQKSTSLGQRFDSFEYRFDSLEHRFDLLDQKVDYITVAHGQQLELIKMRLDQLFRMESEDIGAAFTDISRLKRRVRKLETQVFPSV